MKEEYKKLVHLFGIHSSLWGQMYESFNRHVFCKANQKHIIAMYLILEDFSERAKKENFVYYYKIDSFLDSYKKAVYEKMNI